MHSLKFVCSTSFFVGILGFAPFSQAGQAVNPIDESMQSLLDRYPGLFVQVTNSGVAAIYGKPMTSASTPQQAAQWWLEENLQVLAISGLDLRLERGHALHPTEKFTVLAYRQFMEGVPVEYGRARIIVLNGSPSQVVMVSAKLAARPADGFASDAISSDKASAGVRSQVPHPAKWSEPELVVYAGEDGELDSVVPQRAWKIRGENTLKGDDFVAYTFFVSSADGSILFTRNEKYHADIVGTTHGLATPFGPKDAMYPDDAQNPPTDMALEDVFVQVIGGGTTHSNDDGSFVIPHDGDEEVVVEAQLMGPWVQVFNDAGAELTLSSNVTPPGPADFLFNSLPTEFQTAQVNAMIHATHAHDFYRERAPDFTGIDQVIAAHVNQPATCGAFYSGEKISFYRKGTPCPNAAYSSVIAHEYGHFIVDRLDLPQNAFGEGFGDCLGNLMYNDPMTGRDFIGEGSILRDPIAANQQYPCSEDIFQCGMMLSGVWWDIRLNLDPVLGEEESLVFVQQLFVDWTLMTIGQEDTLNPLGAHSAVEMLIVEDDDGDLENGTPHQAQICAALAKHGILCPGATLVDFVYPDGVPTVFPCDEESIVRVQILPGDLDTPDSSTALLVYKALSGGPPVEVPLMETAPNEYEAPFPAQAEGTGIAFYFQVNTLGGETVFDPADAPSSRYEAVYQCDPPTDPCPADANGDGAVDPLDSGYVSTRFNCQVDAGDSDCDSADVNDDGEVDPLDVGYVLSRFGSCL